MNEIVLGDFKPKSETGKPEPFTIAFVYSNNNKQYVIKGMSSDVDSYIDSRFPKALIYFTFWKDGKCRNFQRASKNLQLYIRRIKSNNRLVWQVLMFGEEGSRELEFRNLPKKWLPEYDYATFYKKKETKLDLGKL